MVYSSLKILLRLLSSYTTVVVRMTQWIIIPSNFHSRILIIYIFFPTILLSVTFPILLQGVVNPYEMFGRDNVAAMFAVVD